MEEQLHKEFRELRRKGVKVKAWWFKARAKKILESHPNACTFKYSDGWFTRFKCRYNISFRKPTNTAQRAPSEKEETIQEFHRQIREVQLGGESDGPQEERFGLHQIANMDQTPLPFSFTSGPTYETTNSSTVWVRGGASGLDKRQCTAQLTIFADGEPMVKPLLIFRGKGKRISLKEQLEYDKRVVVRFQPNAWCDQPVMNYWVKNCWKPNIKEEALLVLDVHKAQKTGDITDALAECEPLLCMSHLAAQALSNHLMYHITLLSRKKWSQQHSTICKTTWRDTCMGNSLLVRGEFYLQSGWVKLNKEIAVRAFKKCGISVAADALDKLSYLSPL